MRVDEAREQDLLLEPAVDVVRLVLEPGRHRIEAADVDDATGGAVDSHRGRGRLPGLHRHDLPRDVDGDVFVGRRVGYAGARGRGGGERGEQSDDEQGGGREATAAGGGSG